MNSFEKLQNSWLTPLRKYIIEIGKESIETKLPDPYNPCKEFSVCLALSSNKLHRSLYLQVNQKQI